MQASCAGACGDLCTWHAAACVRHCKLTLPQRGCSSFNAAHCCWRRCLEAPCYLLAPILCQLVLVRVARLLGTLPARASHPRPGNAGRAGFGRYFSGTAMHHSVGALGRLAAPTRNPQHNKVSGMGIVGWQGSSEMRTIAGKVGTGLVRVGNTAPHDQPLPARSPC